MPALPRAKIGRARAVLFVGPDQVEWFERAPSGAAVFGRGATLGEGPGDVARAARELTRGLGRSPRPCTLVLADALLRERVLPLPALAEREQRSAMRRKAANLAGSKERATVFGALRLGQAARADHPDATPLEKWLLIARERAYLSGLQLQLRRHGFDVERVLPARLVALGHRALCEGRTSDASVVVGIEPDAAVLSLVQGASLVHQTVLIGRLGPGSSLGTTLVQELRGLDLFWRKISRGESVARVLVVGIEPHDSASLQPAICAALPGTRAVLHPDPADLRPDAGRIEALGAALQVGAFGLDLAVPLPPRPMALAVLTGVLGLVAAVAGVVGIDRLEARRETWRSATLAVDSKALGQPTVSRELVEREQDLARLRARRDRLVALDRLGLPFEEMLVDLTEAFRGRGTLSTVAFTHGPQGTQVDATGQTSADPLRGFLALEELRRVLEASPHYRHVEINPPTVLPERRHGRESGEQELPFGLQALREVHP